MLTNHFGDGYFVAGMVLAAVFFGMAAGAWIGGRAARALPGVEALIGLVSIAVAFALSRHGFFIATFGGTGEAVTALKLLTLLGAPMFLIGACVPLFAHALARTGPAGGGGFARIYALYNLGACASVFAIEFVMLRVWGIEATACLVGTVNIAVAVALFLLLQGRAPARPIPPSVSVPARVLIPVALAGAASGAFQLHALKLVFAIFGPLQEHFAVILASAILGIAMGAALAPRLRFGLPEALSLAAFAIASFQLCAPVLVSGWMAVTGLGLSPDAELAVKTLLIAAAPLPVFMAFGTLVPLAVRACAGQGAGPILAAASFGNGIGALAMFLALYRWLEPTQIGVLLCLVAVLAAMVASARPAFRPGPFAGTATLFGCMLLAGVTLWPERELLLGYRALRAPDIAEWQMKRFESAVTYRAYDQNASVVRFTDGVRALVFNGYRSLTFGGESRTVLHEQFVGALPALFSARAEEALVLGLGSGITAGATGRVFARTHVAEINPSMLSIPPHFEDANAGVMHRENVSVAVEDGFLSLLTSSKRYDAIINTVTSPRFYSSSKLYTAEFFALARSRLAKGGVYAGWFDVGIGTEGVSVMLDTLEASFAQCRYFALSRGYFAVICGDDAPIWRSSAEIARRLEGSGLATVDEESRPSGTMAEFVADLEVDFGPDFFARVPSGIHRLDRPVIEYVVTRENDAATLDLLTDMLLANIRFRRDTSFGDQSWRGACRHLAWMTRLKVKGC